MGWSLFVQCPDMGLSDSGESSEAQANRGFRCIDVRLELRIHTAKILAGWSLIDYQLYKQNKTHSKAI